MTSNPQPVKEQQPKRPIAGLAVATALVAIGAILIIPLWVTVSEQIALADATGESTPTTAAELAVGGLALALMASGVVLAVVCGIRLLRVDGRGRGFALVGTIVVVATLLLVNPLLGLVFLLLFLGLATALAGRRARRTPS